MAFVQHRPLKLKVKNINLTLIAVSSGLTKKRILSLTIIEKLNYLDRFFQD